MRQGTCCVSCCALALLSTLPSPCKQLLCANSATTFHLHPDKFVDQDSGIACSGAPTGRQNGANSKGGGRLSNRNGIVYEDEDSDGPRGLKVTEREVPRPKNSMSTAAPTEQLSAKYAAHGSALEQFAGRRCTLSNPLMKVVMVADCFGGASYEQSRRVRRLLALFVELRGMGNVFMHLLRCRTHGEQCQLLQREHSCGSLSDGVTGATVCVLIPSL